MKKVVHLTDGSSPGTKRIADIEKDLEDCPVQDYQLLIEQRDLLAANRKILKNIIK